MRNNRLLLEDVLDQIEFIEQDTGLGYDVFSKDRHLQDSLALRIGYVGEALNKISKDVKASHPEVPWEEAVGMRAKLFHDYFEIDKDIIWKTASSDMPLLKQTIIKLLAEKV